MRKTKSKSLVVGMGIGQLYKTVLKNLGHDVITVDSDISKGADLPNIESALYAHAPFDTVHICTPNFTHESIARKLASVSSLIFIEKPGLENRSAWEKLINDFPRTRFMMVKNNMWRSNIAQLKDLANRSSSVTMLWINKDRVPNPGTWFTTKKLAFGGVSRDLMPHLLSLYIALNPNWERDAINDVGSMRQWELSDLTTTDYGVVKSDGIYDVDDFCYFNFTDKWDLQADWRSNNLEARKIEFILKDGGCEVFELGLCPEEAYQAMIADALEHINDPDFWLNQIKQDLWIHEQLEKYE